MKRAEKRQQKYDKAKQKAAATSDKDEDAKLALSRKLGQKGGSGKLTRAELKLANRMGEGEAAEIRQDREDRGKK